VDDKQLDNVLRSMSEERTDLIAQVEQLTGELAAMESAAARLWDLLDAIDTLSGSMKPKQTRYYRAVVRLVRKRHRVARADGHNLTFTPTEGSKQ